MCCRLRGCLTREMAPFRGGPRCLRNMARTTNNFSGFLGGSASFSGGAGRNGQIILQTSDIVKCCMILKECLKLRKYAHFLSAQTHTQPTLVNLCTISRRHTSFRYVCNCVNAPCNIFIYYSKAWNLQLSHDNTLTQRKGSFLSNHTSRGTLCYLGPDIDELGPESPAKRRVSLKLG